MSLLVLTPWTVAHRVPKSMEFSRQEYWSGLPFSTPGDLPHPGIETSFLLVSCNGRLILYHCTTWEALHPLHPYGIFAYYSNQLIELNIYSRRETRGGV